MKRLRDALYLAGLRMLPHRFGKRLFIDLARRNGVSKIRVNGRYGEIAGVLDDDRPRFKQYFRDGWWQDNQVRILIGYFADEPGGTFLDIGAGIGIVTMAIAQNPHVAVHAFEPEPASFSLLEENVNHNIGTNNVHLYNVAGFSEASTLAFDSRHHWVETGATAETGTTLVAANRLDGILDCRSLKRPIAIKIDAGGCEYQTYLGGRSFTGAAGLAIVEFWPFGWKRQGADLDRMLTMMSEDFSYAGILRTGYAAVPAQLAPFDDIRRELKQLWDSGGRESVDMLLSKNRSIPGRQRR